MVEVLIGGAGPAGAVAALALARVGVRVLLVDRARLPREPSRGVVLSPRAMAELVALGLDAPVVTQALALTGMRITGPVADIVADYPAGGIGRALSRSVLDAHLLQAAASAGAQVREGVEVVEPLVDAGAVRGAVLLVDGRRVRVPAVVTIAADGRQSSLARGLGLVRPSREVPPAVAASFAGVAGLGARAELHVRRGHCIGLTPLPDGTVDVHLVTAPGRRVPDLPAGIEAILGADGRLAERFAVARVTDGARLYRPLMVDVPVAGTCGLLLAGDAAGSTGPFGGDGVRVAVHGGLLAAEVALATLERRGARAHEELTRRRRVAFQAKWRANLRWRALAEWPGGLHAAGVLALGVPAVGRALVAVAGDAQP